MNVKQMFKRNLSRRKKDSNEEFSLDDRNVESVYINFIDGEIAKQITDIKNANRNKDILVMDLVADACRIKEIQPCNAIFFGLRQENTKSKQSKWVLQAKSIELLNPSFKYTLRIQFKTLNVKKIKEREDRKFYEYYLAECREDFKSGVYRDLLQNKEGNYLLRMVILEMHIVNMLHGVSLADLLKDKRSDLFSLEKIMKKYPNQFTDLRKSKLKIENSLEGFRTYLSSKDRSPCEDFIHEIEDLKDYATQVFKVYKCSKTEAFNSEERELWVKPKELCYKYISYKIMQNVWICSYKDISSIKLEDVGIGNEKQMIIKRKCEAPEVLFIKEDCESLCSMLQGYHWLYVNQYDSVFEGITPLKERTKEDLIHGPIERSLAEEVLRQRSLRTKDGSMLRHNEGRAGSYLLRQDNKKFDFIVLSYFANDMTIKHINGIKQAHDGTITLPTDSSVVREFKTINDMLKYYSDENNKEELGCVLKNNILPRHVGSLALYTERNMIHPPDLPARNTTLSICPLIHSEPSFKKFITNGIFGEIMLYQTQEKVPLIVKRYQTVDEMALKLLEDKLMGVCNKNQECLFVRFWGKLEISKEKCLMGFEYMEGGNLEEQLPKIRDHVTFSTLFGYMKQLTQAVFFLHTNNILHGDIQLSNVYIYGQKHLKLANTATIPDLMAFIDPQTRKNKFLHFDPWWLLSLKEGNNDSLCRQGDIWCLGLTFWHLFSCEKPLRHFTFDKLWQVYEQSNMLMKSIEREVLVELRDQKEMQLHQNFTAALDLPQLPILPFHKDQYKHRITEPSLRNENPEPQTILQSMLQIDRSRRKPIEAISDVVSKLFHSRYGKERYFHTDWKQVLFESKVVQPTHPLGGSGFSDADEGEIVLDYSMESESIRDSFPQSTRFSAHKTLTQVSYQTNISKHEMKDSYETNVKSSQSDTESYRPVSELGEEKTLSRTIVLDKKPSHETCVSPPKTVVKIEDPYTAVEGNQILSMNRANLPETSSVHNDTAQVSLSGNSSLDDALVSEKSPLHHNTAHVSLSGKSSLDDDLAHALLSVKSSIDDDVLIINEEDNQPMDIDHSDNTDSSRPSSPVIQIKNIYSLSPAKDDPLPLQNKDKPVHEIDDTSQLILENLQNIPKVDTNENAFQIDRLVENDSKVNKPILLEDISKSDDEKSSISGKRNMESRPVMQPYKRNMVINKLAIDSAIKSFKLNEPMKKTNSAPTSPVRPVIHRDPFYDDFDRGKGNLKRTLAENPYTAVEMLKSLHTDSERRAKSPKLTRGSPLMKFSNLGDQESPKKTSTPENDSPKQKVTVKAEQKDIETASILASLSQNSSVQFKRTHEHERMEPTYTHSSDYLDVTGLHSEKKDSRLSELIGFKHKHVSLESAKASSDMYMDPALLKSKERGAPDRKIAPKEWLRSRMVNAYKSLKKVPKKRSPPPTPPDSPESVRRDVSEPPKVEIPNNDKTRLFMQQRMHEEQEKIYGKSLATFEQDFNEYKKKSKQVSKKAAGKPNPFNLSVNIPTSLNLIPKARIEIMPPAAAKFFNEITENCKMSDLPIKKSFSPPPKVTERTDGIEMQKFVNNFNDLHASPISSHTPLSVTKSVVNTAPQNLSPIPISRHQSLRKSQQRKPPPSEPNVFFNHAGKIGDTGSSGYQRIVAINQSTVQQYQPASLIAFNHLYHPPDRPPALHRAIAPAGPRTILIPQNQLFATRSFFAPQQIRAYPMPPGVVEIRTPHVISTSSVPHLHPQAHLQVHRAPIIHTSLPRQPNPPPPPPPPHQMQRDSPSHLTSPQKKFWNIDPKDLVQESLLGQGNFGEVWIGKWSVRSERAPPQVIPVAVKTLRCNMPETQSSDIAEFREEANTMCQLTDASDPDNQFLIKLFGVCADPTSFKIVMEYARFGSLQYFIPNYRNELDVNILNSFCRQIARGVDYLHRHKLIHRDLACRNVLAVSKDLVKLADFGLSRFLINKKYYTPPSNQPIPVNWLALESLSVEPVYSFKTDFWTYGVLVWEVYTLFSAKELPVVPYKEFHMLYEEEQRRHPNKKFSFIKMFTKHLSSGHRLLRPELCPSELWCIVKKCWDAVPDNRPSLYVFKEVLGSLLQNSK